MQAYSQATNALDIVTDKLRVWYMKVLCRFSICSMPWHATE